MAGDLVLPPSLEDVRISQLPSSAFYISEFITEEEEQIILGKISAAPKPRWKQLIRRRLQTWPSDLVKDRLVESPLPTWLEEPIVSRLRSIALTADASLMAHVFSDSPHQRPNHVLVNEYPPGIGIMPHKDGPTYHPVVCTVSLGGTLCLNIHRMQDDGTLDDYPVWRILQEPRSLLITTQSLYTDYLHGIADTDEDIDLSNSTIANWSLLRSHSFDSGRSQRQPRTSLTYRDVIRTSKLGSKLGLFNHKR